MELRWRISVGASSLHAAGLVVQGRDFADPELGQAMKPPAEELARMLGMHQFPPSLFLNHAAALAGDDEETPRSLAELTVRRMKGAEAAEEMGRWFEHPLADLRRELNLRVPDLPQQLRTRLGPIREQWESRGPGVLAAMRRESEAELFTEGAAVLLVHPFAGGGGEAHPWYNSVRLEAVLTHPVPELPEPLRLAWMLAQLNLDLARFRDDPGLSRSWEVGSASLLPLVLHAGEQVEWCRFDRPTLALAIREWLPPAAHSMVSAEALEAWWNVYQEQRPSWPLGMQALNSMLGLG